MLYDSTQMWLLHFWEIHGQSASDQRPAFLELRSDKNFIISAVAMATFTDIFLYGLIIPVFPFALESRVNIHPTNVQTWISVLVAVYGAGLLVASPICGYIADRTTTRRSPLLCGLVALAGSTVMLCMGSSITVLVIGRLLQGVAAAVVWVVGLALLVDTVGKDEIGQSMGIISAATSAAVFLAPLLGGVVYDKGGYYAVFAMAFALLGIDIVWRLALIEKRVAIRYAPPTLTDSIRGVVSSAAATQDLNIDPKTSDAEAATILPTCRKRSCIISRLPPVITLLRYPRLLCALWAIMVGALLMTGLETTLPLYTRDTFRFGPMGAGLIFLGVVIPTFLAPLTGWACDKYGPRWIETLGFVLSCPFMVLLRLPDGDGIEQVALMSALLVLLGIAFALVIPPVMAEITLALRELEEKKPGIFGPNGAYAQGYGLFNVAWSAGTLVGPLWSGFVRDAAGWGTMTWSLGLLGVATAIPVAVYTGGKISKADFKAPKNNR